MTTTGLIVILGLAAGTWLLWRLRTPTDVGVEDAAFRASVVVPARNEAATLPHLLASLAAQRPTPHEVIVVDDGSGDGTGDVARRAGATVISALPPPAGWLGKPWACHTGAAAASGEVLVFVDADTWFGPRSLTRVLGAHAALAPDGLVSVQPFHGVERPYEHLSAIPNAVAMMATGAFAVRPLAGRPVAFGPCLVTDAAAYRGIGGHATVRAEVIEDLHLARAYGRSGRPVACLAGGADVAFRMYPRDLGQLVEGWSKNLAGGPRLTPRLPTLGAVAWVTAVAAMTAAGAAAVLDVATGGPARWWVPAGWLAVTLQVRWVLRRIGSYRWWAAVAFPLPLLAFLGLFLRSVVVRSVRGRVTWRGRDIGLQRGPVT